MNARADVGTSALEAVSRSLPDSTLTVEQARSSILSQVRPLAGFERVSLRHALGRVLAEDVVASIDVPAYQNAAVDGFALSSETLPECGGNRLRIVGTSLAGHRWESVVSRGECARVMTGAALPGGCDTVVPHEACRLDGEHVLIDPGRVKPGDNVRQRGEDLQAGRPALRAGAVLRPAHLGLMGSLGRCDVTVHPRLRAAFLSTGDELRSIGEPLDEGCVFDSNRHSLWGMLDRLGCEAVDLGMVRDDPLALEAALISACECADVVITTGGVGGGAADHLRDVLTRLGEVSFWRIAMRPGRPLAFGRILLKPSHSTLVFGLPGNPVATMVAFYMIVRDALLRIMGANPKPVPLMRVRAMEPLSKLPGRVEYQRGVLDMLQGGEWGVRTTGPQGSGVLRSMSEADGLIVLEAARGRIEAGEFVGFLSFDGLA